MKILAFAASNSKQSLNKELARYAAGLLDDASVEVLDLNDYELPLFSVDREAQIGQPEPAKAFLAKIAESDALIISFAEHNGTYSAAYKNLFDWCSRINKKVYQQKDMILLATSPGPGGAARVLEIAKTSAPHFDGVVKASLSMPNFHDNFDVESGRIKNNEIKEQLIHAVQALLA
ncbi:NADPH-dependent FMN reductase [Methyloprofundus sedimenti]|uniref:NADPH-dependent FMN reductase n=1 Tax=Methyloprofundus sedimenti TaxID=1420851 RepID=A0A1V8M3K4_9GAMM|nr:NAD(P)H-dependent oxidoreductase [Methyloprofundus sedimenti]OQK16147.1 NADPH-dependent FMN reductase [Methyloprofundus sedimenti]